MPARPAVSVRTEQAEDRVRAENEGNDALNCDGARVAELARRLTLGLTRETCPRSYLVEEPSDGSQVRFEADASSGPSGNSSPTMVVSLSRVSGSSIGRRPSQLVAAQLNFLEAGARRRLLAEGSCRRRPREDDFFPGRVRRSCRRHEPFRRGGPDHRLSTYLQHLPHRDSPPGPRPTPSPLVLHVDHLPSIAARPTCSRRHGTQSC